jgi:hypothetical protein
MQVICLVAIYAIAAEPGVPDETRTELLRGMRDRAQQTAVSIAKDGGLLTAELIRDPLFRYSDQPRDIVDATFWGWQRGGRPIAFQKVEVYRQNGEWHWFYCFASAADELIEIRWDAGERWMAKRPGVTWRELPDSPQVAETGASKLLQARRIARRFSVKSTDEIAKIEEELRFLSKPIYEYGEPIHGVLFGFAANGTNPDALLLLQPERSGERWEYAWIQMTAGRLTARLDGKVVWTAPYQVPNPARPSKFDTWLFFRESAATGADR